ncbi:MAG: hypothetical protein FWG50_00460 [Kiritimatiellaeota bacterium]|nr:hypothetical protein [Kiritimatiellota bacterium]
MKKALVMMMAAATGAAAMAEVSPYAGLWVGSVGLTTVNEVSIPLDADNVPRAPDPLKPTVTGSRADLRLIIHVDAAGRASLLKDVAVVNRNPSGDASATIADIAAAGSDEFALSLVTDPALYAEYPMQKATRISSVAFDFGDAQATLVLDALVGRVVGAAVDVVSGKPASAIDTAAKRNQIIEDIVAAAQGMAMPPDNVASTYQAFLDSVKDAVPAIASSPSPSAGAAALWMNTANILFNGSSFGDTRAQDLVRAVQAAGMANGGADAWNAASGFADTSATVTRLLVGKAVGDALAGAAQHAANTPGATAGGLKGLDTSADAVAAALASKWHDNDTRATGALDAMFAAIAATAADGHAAGDLIALEIQEQAYAAGAAALTAALAQYPAPRNAPTDGYTAFVTSADYAAVPEKAARAAAAAALTERVENPLTYTLTLPSVAKAAAMNALQATYAAAARAKLNELPLAGVFALGEGDPRFAVDVETGDMLGAAGLTGRLLLPANFPTNPFRHRRHPDHTQGYDVTRNIRIDFDAPEEPGKIPSVTRGVKQVSGLYREEVFGLHKPLGPGQDVGLRTEGRFELNRISTISTLNGK